METYIRGCYKETVKLVKGQKVRILGGSRWCKEAKDDIRKIGILVHIDGEEYIVFIPSSKNPPSTFKGITYTWAVAENEIIPLGQVQLLFSFMDDIYEEE